MKDPIKILFVEDTLTDAELIWSQIKSDGIFFTHKLVDTKLAYINMIETFVPDMIISDYRLPQFDGMQALSIRNEIAASTPFLLVTGSINEEVAVSCMKAGADDYIIKENLSRLGTAIKASLKNREVLSQKEKAEELLRENEKKYRALFDGANDAIIILSGEKFIECNEMALIMFGLRHKEDIINHTPWELSPPKQPDGRLSVDKAGELIMKVLDGTPQRFEWKHIKSNGDEFDVEVSLSRVALDNNILIQSIVRDVTEQKRAEEQLIIAKEKAEESDRLKTAFLHNISHEIRTPMNAIIGFSSLLSEPDIDRISQQSYIEVITQGSNQLLAIVNDIIEISNIEVGIIRYNPVVVNLNSTLAGLHNQCNPVASTKGIQLHYETPLSDTDSNIITDKTKLIQILSNLINNALKFTSSGSVDFGYELKKDAVEFHISDTGIGIAEDQYLKIFDRFYQVEYSVSRLYEGTGLGLSISKAYVELLGGRIWLNSQVGKGTDFYFTIPYLRQEESVIDSKMPRILEKSTHIGKKTILIAEDEENNFRLIEVLLAKLNLNMKLNILHAGNGKDAVEICKSRQDIDLVIMDIKMPVMDGLEATGIIKKMNPGLPVLALTAFAFESDKEKIFKAGCDDYISKPVNKEMLFTVLKKYL